MHSDSHNILTTFDLTCGILYILDSNVVELNLCPSGPDPAAVKARTAIVYIVAGSNPVKSVIVLSTPITSLPLVQSGTKEPRL